MTLRDSGGVGRRPRHGHHCEAWRSKQERLKQEGIFIRGGLLCNCEGLVVIGMSLTEACEWFTNKVNWL